MKRTAALAAVTASATAGLLALTGFWPVLRDTRPADPADTEVRTAAELGRPIPVEGLEPDSELQVTVDRVTTTRSTDPEVRAERGNRLVAVRLTLDNTGGRSYADAPANNAAVVDRDGQQFPADETFRAVTAGAVLPEDLRLRAGSDTTGWLVFQVPRETEVERVQFSLDSGFGDTARWDVR